MAHLVEHLDQDLDSISKEGAERSERGSFVDDPGARHLRQVVVGPRLRERQDLKVLADERRCPGGLVGLAVDAFGLPS